MIECLLGNCKLGINYSTRPSYLLIVIHLFFFFYLSYHLGITKNVKIQLIF